MIISANQSDLAILHLRQSKKQNSAWVQDRPNLRKGMKENASPIWLGIHGVPPLREESTGTGRIKKGMMWKQGFLIIF